AEDGIRDGHVTGVQTCALPISRGHSILTAPGARDFPPVQCCHRSDLSLAQGDHRHPTRYHTPCDTYPTPQPDCEQSRPQSKQSSSEERRIGKECRSPQWADCYE